MSFWKRYHEEQFCEIISNFDQLFRGRYSVNLTYLELWGPSCLAERNGLCNLSRGHYGEHLCEIVLNLDQWFRRRCSSKKKFTDNRRITCED